MTLFVVLSLDLCRQTAFAESLALELDGLDFSVVHKLSRAKNLGSQSQDLNQGPQGEKRKRYKKLRLKSRNN